MKIPTTTDIPQRYTWCLAGICYSSLAILPSFLSYAESYFNPAFLLENGTSVADLSRFERGNHQPAGVYRVDLWRNDEFIGSQDIVFESTTENTGDKSGGLMPCFNQVLLERISLNSSAFPELAQQQNNKCINLLKAVPDATINFDFAAMRLNITIPQIALLSSAHGYIPPEEWDEGIPALLLNYNFTGNRGNGNDSYFFSELSGINIGPWRLRNNGSWNYFRGNGYHSEQWNNIGTWVQRAIIPLKSELVMGDGNTGSDIFDGVGFRGIRLYSSDNMYPDSQQGFAPTVRGIARTAAQLTIRQNGFIIYQSYVSPGAFEITDLHPTSSNGDLDVTIDERDGNQQNYTIPYSTVPILQREGRFKFDLTAGDFRSGNSQQSSPFFFQGTALGGLPQEFTAYGGTQLSANYTAFLLGLGRNLGNWGTVSLDVTHARSQLADDSRHEGDSIRFLYANSTGVAEDEHYDLSNIFNSTNNQPGQIVVLPEKSGWVGVSAICPPGTLVNYTYRSYVTNFIVQETIDNYKYMQLHDYLLGAMSLVDSVMDIQFPPQNYIRMGTDPNVSQNLPFGVMDSRLIFRLKVIRPFINMVEIPRQVMFTVYVTSTPYDPLVTPVYTISFGGRVEVPQNCELNAGQIVEFDFGDIGASLFSAAGPGNRPAGVMPQTKSIAVKCTNVAAQAYLTMRLEASAVSGQAMVSDNQDLGFIVADQNDTPITPNDLNSVIPFRLDAAAAANVTLRAWPISITGQKPTEGPFSALGYLRVDYQ